MTIATLQDLQKYSNSTKTALYSNIEIQHIDVVRKILKENKISTNIYYRAKNRRKVENYYINNRALYLQCLKKDATTFSVYEKRTTKSDDRATKFKTEVLHLLHELSEYVMNSDYSQECNTYVYKALDKALADLT